jgi:hypothetical protein
MLLKYLQAPSPAEENKKELIAIIHSIIETSIALQNKINIYLSRTIIQDTDLKLLYELFQYYNPILLPNLDKQTYLHSILNKYERRSCDFYINWFEYFVCDTHYVDTEQEWSYFQVLLNDWSEKIVRDRILFREIMNKMDNLLQRLSHVTKDRRFIHFVKHMVDQCFKQGIKCNSQFECKHIY